MTTKETKKHAACERRIESVSKDNDKLRKANAEWESAFKHREIIDSNELTKAEISLKNRELMLENSHRKIKILEDSCSIREKQVEDLQVRLAAAQVTEANKHFELKIDASQLTKLSDEITVLKKDKMQLTNELALSKEAVASLSATAEALRHALKDQKDEKDQVQAALIRCNQNERLATAKLEEHRFYMKNVRIEIVAPK